MAECIQYVCEEVVEKIPSRPSLLAHCNSMAACGILFLFAGLEYTNPVRTALQQYVLHVFTRCFHTHVPQNKKCAHNTSCNNTSCTYAGGVRAGRLYPQGTGHRISRKLGWGACVVCHLACHDRACLTSIIYESFFFFCLPRQILIITDGAKELPTVTPLFFYSVFRCIK